METGSMESLIRIKVPTGGRDPATGQVLNTFENIENRPQEWAQVQDDGGDELFQSDKKTATSRKTFKVHYREDLNEMMIVEYQGRWFDIDRIQEIRRRKGLLIHAFWTQGKYDE